MAMTDEDRLVDEFAHVLCVRRHGTHLHHLEEAARINLLLEARGFVEHLRSRGVTITPPPAPEPTYTITMTRAEQKMVMRALQFTQRNNACLDHGECDGYLELWERVQMLEPDPEPQP